MAPLCPCRNVKPNQNSQPENYVSLQSCGRNIEKGINRAEAVRKPVCYFHTKRKRRKGAGYIYYFFPFFWKVIGGCFCPCWRYSVPLIISLGLRPETYFLPLLSQGNERRQPPKWLVWGHRWSQICCLCGRVGCVL